MYAPDEYDTIIEQDRPYKTFHWISERGTRCYSQILAQFTHDGKDFVVVQVGRGPYDTAPPYAVFDAAEGEII